MKMATHRSQLALARMHDAKKFVMLAHTYSDRTPVIGWRMEEKIDGVRARWHKGAFYSRTGRRFPTPPEVLTHMRRQFDDLPLDGELSCGRGEFQRAVSIVRNSHSTARDWLQVRYHVFDLVVAGDYQWRRQILETEIAGEDLLVSLLPSLGVVETEEEIDRAHRRIISLGGEGLIFRNPAAEYTFGRSRDLLKLKRWLEAEAVVVQVVPGDGKHYGRMGALLCRAKDGTLFHLGTGFTDIEREQDELAWLGKLVTYRYTELTKAGVPRMPKFVAVRDYE